MKDERITTAWRTGVPTGVSGRWAVERYSVSKDAASLEAIRAVATGRYVPEGTYTALKRYPEPSSQRKGGGSIIMSDTPDELRDHREAVYQAQVRGGYVLVAGLGLGCAVELMLRNDSKVERVTVVEKSPDVIQLVGPYLQKVYGDRLEIVEGDIFEWKPPKGVRYSCAWFDIWDNLCGDNLPEMTRLSRKFARRADWKGHWGKAWIQRHAR